MRVRGLLLGSGVHAGSARQAIRPQLVTSTPPYSRTLSGFWALTIPLRCESGSVWPWAGEAGDPAWACQQYAALLPDAERTWGTDHPDTLAAHRGLS
jgi:hypothetical protein